MADDLECDPLYQLVRLVHSVVLEDDELRRLKQRNPDRIVRTLTTPDVSS